MCAVINGCVKVKRYLIDARSASVDQRNGIRKAPHNQRSLPRWLPRSPRLSSTSRLPPNCLLQPHISAQAMPPTANVESANSIQDGDHPQDSASRVILRKRSTPRLTSCRAPSPTLPFQNRLPDHRISLDGDFPANDTVHTTKRSVKKSTKK